eukprot:3929771-Rhodomonas_salina.1
MPPQLSASEMELGSAENGVGFFPFLPNTRQIRACQPAMRVSAAGPYLYGVDTRLPFPAPYARIRMPCGYMRFARIRMPCANYCALAIPKHTVLRTPSSTNRQYGALRAVGTGQRVGSSGVSTGRCVGSSGVSTGQRVGSSKVAVLGQ